VEQAGGVTDVKHFGNDYNRNRVGPTKFSSAGGQMQISPEMKNKLKSLVENGDLPDSARRALHKYLDR
jgi:hypothetical protein